MDIWRILAIEATKDKDAIRDAYRARLVHVHPEEDPEGFKQLREAFEEAVRLADQPDETEQEQVSDEELSVFDRVQKIAIGIYDDLSTRINEDSWKALLAMPEFEELDTSDEAREALLVVFMNRIFLPQNIWELVVKTLLVEEEREQLIEKFPPDYIDYVIGRAASDDIISFEMFSSREAHLNEFAKDSLTDGPLETTLEVPIHPGFDSYFGDVDQYINALRFLWPAGDVFFTEEDPEKLQENQIQICSLIRYLESMDLWHPEEYFAKMRYYSFSDTPEKGVAMALPVLQGQADVSEERLFFEAARVYLSHAENKDPELMDLIRTGTDKKIEEDPQNYWAALNRVLYLYADEKYEDSAEKLVDMLADFGDNTLTVNLLHKMDEILVPKYEKLMEEDPSNDEYLICRVRYLGQLNRWDEALEILRSRTVSDEWLPDQLWFTGRGLLFTEKTQEGYDFLQKWRAWLEPVVAQAEEAEKHGEEPDHTTRMRLSRKLSTYGALGEACISLKKYDEAVENFEKLLSFETSPRYRIPSILGIVKACEMTKQYYRAMQLIEQLVNEYGPELENLMIVHQNNAYRIEENQAIIDDFYRIIEVEPTHPRAYLLAFRVFMRYDQTEDAQGVIERAKANQVSKILTDYMEIIMRREAIENGDQAVACLDEMLEFRDNITPVFEASEDNRVFNMSDLRYQIAELAFQIRRNEGSCKIDAMQEAREALKNAPDNWDFITSCLVLMVRNLPDTSDPDAVILDLADGEAPDADLYYSVGWYYYNQKDPSRAIPCLEKAVQLAPNYANARYRLMMQYKTRFLRTGDPADLERAEREADGLLAAEPTFSNHLESGDMYLFLEKFDKAIKAYEGSLEIKPEDYRSYNGLGLTYCDMKDYDQAIRCFKTALARNAGRRDVKYIYNNLIRTYRRDGKPEEALSVWEERASIYEPNEDDLDERGTLLFAARRHEEGGIEFRRLLEQAAADPVEADGKKNWDKIQRIIDLFIRSYEAAVFTEKPKEEAEGIKRYLEAFLKKHDLLLTPKKTLFGSGVRSTSKGKIYLEAKEPYADNETGRAISWILSNLGLFYLYTVRDFQSALLYLLRWVSYNRKELKDCTNYDLSAVADRKVDIALALAFLGDQELADKYADEVFEILCFRQPEEVILKYPGHGFYISKTLMQAAGIKGDPNFMKYLDITKDCVLCDFCKHQGCYEQFLLVGRALEVQGRYKEAEEYYSKAFDLEAIDCEAKVARDICRKKING
ncbi:MAG: tetratricopeptide repeat protein [Lachnospiraceae bacterium]|nr:tetratricopeptide repeat protein [Lachnospiraceae bacterium]